VRGTALAYRSCDIKYEGAHMGRIFLGIIIGVVLVIWLFTSCVGAIL
jgi:hypothetical protein